MYDNADFRIFDFGEGDDEIGGRLIEWELTEANGGGLGKSPKGIYLMGPGDYPREEETVQKESGEAVKETPN
jgi:hypothetical protein